MLQACLNVPFVGTLSNIEMAMQTAQGNETSINVDAMDLLECFEFFEQNNMRIPNLLCLEELRDKIRSLINTGKSGQNPDDETVSITF